MTTIGCDFSSNVTRSHVSIGPRRVEFDAAVEQVDTAPRKVEHDGRSVELQVGRPRLHAVARRTAEPLCRSADARLLPTGQAWTAETPDHVERCGGRLEVAPLSGTEAPRERTWSWVADEVEQMQRVEHARRLIGSAIDRVTWDPPGLREGIGLREEPLLGTGVRVDGATAIWDVTNTSGWVHLLGRATSDVVLHYLPSGDPGGFWCPRITLRFPGATVELLLREGGPNRELGPSADNVAVLFDPERLTDWEQAKD